MTKIRLNYRWAITFIAVAAIALSQSLHPVASPLAGAAVADLTLERQTLTSFGDDLSGLEKKVVELQKKLTITSTELNFTTTSASTLKNKTPQIQQTILSVINKLKTAREWENFDAAVLARVTDAKTQSLIRDAGGAKKLLEDAALQSGALSQDIDALVQPLSAKVASTGSSFGNIGRLGFVPMRASFTPTVPAARSLGKCLFRLAAYVVVGARLSEQKAQCACNQNPTAADVQYCNSL